MSKKKEVTIEEIPENQVSNRILYIRGINKGNKYFPLSLDILLVNTKKAFRKQGKYLGQKMTPNFDGVNYKFSFDGKITEFKYKFTDKKNVLEEDYKFYIDTKSYKNKKQKDFYCNKLEGKKFNLMGFKGKMTKEDVEKECINFYKNQNKKLNDKNKKIIEIEKKQRNKQLNSLKKIFEKEIKKESTNKVVVKKPVKKINTSTKTKTNIKPK